MSNVVPKGHIIKYKSDCQFSWVIPQYLSVCRNVKPGQFIRSPLLTSVGSKGSWYVTIYPDAENVTICLEYCCKDDVKASANVMFEMRFGMVPVTFSRKNAVQWECKLNRGNEQLVLTSSNGADNALVLVFNILEKCHYNHIRPEVSIIKRLEVFDEFGKLLYNYKHSDVTLVVGGERLFAHKCILAKGSPVFAAMFDHDMVENQKNIVEIPDVTPDVMRKLLQFMYVGKVGDIKPIARDLYIVADKYGVSDLKHICEFVMAENLSKTNIFDSIHFADFHAAKILKISAIRFIARNEAELLAME